MFLPFHTLRKIFLKGLTDFSAFFNSFFDPVLLCHSTLLGTCDSTLIHSFGRGSFSLILKIYMYTFLSRISSIILHVSFLPNFRKCHSSIHSFLEGMISLYFSIVSSTSNLGKANGRSFEKKKKPIGSGY